MSKSPQTFEVAAIHYAGPEPDEVMAAGLTFVAAVGEAARRNIHPPSGVYFKVRPAGTTDAINALERGPEPGTYVLTLWRTRIAGGAGRAAVTEEEEERHR
jgi:hypothetical protein